MHRRDVALDGSAPALLVGLRHVRALQRPGFRARALSLLDRGFVCAIAHVRGGGELGREWYESGRLEHKANTFTDFLACAEELSSRATRAARLVARGGSAGGLLMGAVTNLRPDLFAAIVAEVPFVDVVTTMLDPDAAAHHHRVGGVGRPAGARRVRRA